MSDVRLRDLERRWRAGGAPEDDARLVLERARRGEVAQEELELAASLGHPGACAALGRTADPLHHVAARLAADAARRGPAAAALAELALPAWTFPLPPEEAVPGEWVRDAVRTLRAARDRPGPGAQQHAGRAAMLAGEAADEAHDSHTLLGVLAARLVGFAAHAFFDADPRTLTGALRLAAGLFGEARAREALAAGVLPATLRPAAPPGPPPEWTSEVDLLRGRLADGALTAERLALAHALGHGEASEALGLERTAPTTTALLEGVGSAARLGAEAGVRAIVALANDEVVAGADTPAGLAIQAAEAWVVAPTPALAAEALAAAQRADAAPRSTPHRPAWHELSEEAPVEPSAPELAALAARAAHRAGTLGDAPTEELRRALEVSAARPWTAPLVVVASEVVPWVLGYHDPVRDRRDLGFDLLAAGGSQFLY